MPSNETGTGMTAQGSTDIQTYVTILDLLIKRMDMVGVLRHGHD
jgi:hypothetical protein